MLPTIIKQIVTVKKDWHINSWRKPRYPLRPDYQTFSVSPCPMQSFEKEEVSLELITKFNLQL